MESSKFENILNLAVDATPEEREKSAQLGVGYIPTENSWDLIVKTAGDLENFSRRFPEIQVKPLLNQYAILLVPEHLLEDVANAPEITYVEKPKSLFFADMQGKRASCIPPLQTSTYNLTGKGVIVAVIDSGVDYAHPDFCNPDGTTRILHLWDQSLNREFSAEEINEALRLPTEAQRHALVPSRDLSGHGTHVLGIAAGNGAASDGGYRGVAFESPLIVVKLGNPREESFPRTTELMEGLDYVLTKAQEHQMPVAVNISFGNNYGSHTGTSLLETYIDDVSSFWKNSIVIGTGNEGYGKIHTSGVLTTGEEELIEFTVGEYETTLNLQVWSSYVDDFDISIIHPNGQSAGPIKRIQGPQRLALDGTNLLLYYGEPHPYTIFEEIYMDFLPETDYLSPGIWQIRLTAHEIRQGNYDMWMPSQTAIGTATGFLYPSEENTLTIPSTATKAITVGAYDSLYGQLADFSGRGNAREGYQGKPDIAAPGVNITSCAPGGGYVSKSGTSMATPFVCGSAALLMEWGIVDNHDPFLYGEKIKAFLMKGAKTLPALDVYPNSILGWGTLCLRDSLP